MRTFTLTFCGFLALTLFFVGCSAEDAPNSDPGATDGASTARPKTVEAEANLDDLLVRAAKLEKDMDYEGAVALYRQALEIDPDHEQARIGAALKVISAQEASLAQQRNVMGRRLAQTGRPVEAREEFAAARRLDPNRLVYLFDLGICAIETRRFARARELLHQVLERDPKHVRARINLAVASYRGGNFTQCLEDLDTLAPHYDKSDDQKIRNAHTDSRLLFMRGVCAKNLERMAQAIDHLDRAGKLQPDDGEIQSYLGGVYMTEGRFDDAIRCFNKAAIVQPRSASNHFYMGRCHEKSGRFAEAIASFAESYRRDNSHWLSHVYAGRCYEKLGSREDLARAIGQLELALQKNPFSHEALFTLARVHKRLGNATEAAETHERFQQIKAVAEAQESKLRTINQRLIKNSDDIDALLESAEINLRFRHWKEAHELVQRVLIIDPRHPEGLRHSSHLQMVYLHDPQAARHEALKLIDVAPKDHRGYMIAGYGLMSMQRGPEALAMAKKALAIEADDFMVVNLMIETLKANGKAEDAAAFQPELVRLGQERQLAAQRENEELMKLAQGATDGGGDEPSDG